MRFVRYALIYGVLSGSVIVGVILAGLGLSRHGSFFGSELFGYLAMLVALTFIFVGVKRYRDVEYGGVIKFLPALGVGLSIALVAALAYVAIWETYLAATNYSFMDEYLAGIRQAKEAQGITGAALEAEMAPMEAMRGYYANPVLRVGITFLEIFPVGLIVAILSALALMFPKVLPARG